jgi:glycine oxidase
MAMADITVRGAGAFGLAIAWACTQRGARVQVVDPQGPGAGASGGIVGALAPHVPENWNPKKQFQLESLLMATTFWAEVEAAGHLSAGYGRCGRLQPLKDARAVELAHQRAISAKDLWQGQAQWQVRPVTDLGPWCPPSPTGLVVQDSRSGRLHPRQSCAALVAALTAHRVPILRDAPDAGLVLHAKGHAGLQELNIAFDRPLGNGVKGQAALLRYDAGAVPQLYADGLHIIPHADGTVAIGSTSERDYDDPTSTDAQLDAVIARARAAVPVLADAAVIERWAGLRPRAKSRAPMLGQWPDRPGHFIANGGFKIGFGMAPKVASVMADLMLDRVDAIPAGFAVSDNL